MRVDILSRLSKVRQTGRDSWIACCPAHDDNSPSLTIRDVDGKVLLHCFSGCEPLAVIESIGLRFEDLFPEPLQPSKPLRRPFPAADVLEALSLESKVVAVIAHRVKEGLPLSESDYSRLGVALWRIEEGRELANG